MGYRERGEERRAGDTGGGKGTRRKERPTEVGGVWEGRVWDPRSPRMTDPLGLWLSYSSGTRLGIVSEPLSGMGVGKGLRR